MCRPSFGFPPSQSLTLSVSLSPAPCRAGPNLQTHLTPAKQLNNTSATTPTEQQFYDALSPDLKRKVDEARALKAGAREELAKASQDKLNTIRVRSVSLPPPRYSLPIPAPGTDRDLTRKRRSKLGAKHRCGQMQLRRTPKQSDDGSLPPSLRTRGPFKPTLPTLHLHPFRADARALRNSYSSRACILYLLDR